MATLPPYAGPALRSASVGSRACVSFDHAGEKSYNTCAAWAIQLFHQAYLRGDLGGEAYRNMHEGVLRARSRLNSLYAYQHQVIPFVYSHLVSLACFLYLAFFAVEKGSRFAPEATYLFGLLIPAASFLITLITTLGLVEIGQTIANPFKGDDIEDFVIPSFLTSTAKLTRYMAFSQDVNAPHEPRVRVGDQPSPAAGQPQGSSAAANSVPPPSVDELLNGQQQQGGAHRSPEAGQWLGGGGSAWSPAAMAAVGRYQV